MTINQRRKTLINVSIAVLVAIVIVTYGLFQARNLLLGPRLSIVSPVNGAVSNNPLVTVAGNAQNVSSISLNGRPIFIDPSGNFNEQLLLSVGYNLWTISAQDRFGRTISKNIELVFNKT